MASDVRMVVLRIGRTAVSGQSDMAQNHGASVLPERVPGCVSLDELRGRDGLFGGDCVFLARALRGKKCEQRIPWHPGPASPRPKAGERESGKFPPSDLPSFGRSFRQFHTWLTPHFLLEGERCDYQWRERSIPSNA